jgi:hypothetical protein
VRPNSPSRAVPAVIAVLLALAAPGGAMGHGDPASHYLEAEPLYPAFADRPSQAVELKLLGLLQAAERSGYPIKVALVAAPGDLTDDPSMLRTPQRYADFVSRELGAGVRAPIVVATPFGFGVSGAGVRHSLLSGVRPQGGGDSLALAAMEAVRQIARAGGHPLPANVPPAPLLGATAPADAGGAGSSGLVRVAALFGVTFLVLFAAFELWSRRGRRRAASHAPRTPRRTARASAPPPPARRS